MVPRLSDEKDAAQSCRDGGPSGATGTFPSLTEGESVPNWNRGSPGRFGIDRLAISFPVCDWLDLPRWDSVRTDRNGEWTAQTMVGGSGGVPSVMVGVRTVAGQPWGKVECNPARFADPNGCSLLDPQQLPAAFHVMWSAACEVTAPLWKLADARVRRGDIARDFRGITAPNLYVEGLQPLKRPYARRAFLYNDPQHGNAETLFVGSNAGAVRLYDQHAAYADKGAPEGSLRFEIEARTGWLEHAGVSRVADFDAVVCARIAEDRWEWSRMGTPVSGPVNAVQLLQRKVIGGEISQAVADRLLGSMVRRSLGFGTEAKTSEWRHRQVLGQLGMTAGALWSNDLDRQAVGRLDFAGGTEELSLTEAAVSA